MAITIETGTVVGFVARVRTPGHEPQTFFTDSSQVVCELIMAEDLDEYPEHLRGIWKHFYRVYLEGAGDMLVEVWGQHWCTKAGDQIFRNTCHCGQVWWSHQQDHTGQCEHCWSEHYDLLLQIKIDREREQL